MIYNLNEGDLDKYVYRIIPLDRFFELFETKRNVLVKPLLWDDPYENFILRSKVKLKSGEVVQYNYHDRIYGQCWTLQASSDAIWRIYSPKKNGIRIRTTIRSLIESLSLHHADLTDTKCGIGKVEYKSEKELLRIANSTFDDSGILVSNIFKSLLGKRKAFSHEKEVRLLYVDMDDEFPKEDLYSYEIDPHNLVDQIMIDPRVTYTDFKNIKDKIKRVTGFEGSILRSLLYSFKNDLVLDVTDDLAKYRST
ncbi:MAG: DUF2971 domain-containing protein [Thermodesulfobacteriota bacterium]|nr:DUF2971 domain-containing protein [Thermodesulfobacteriota bacterium]